MRVRIVGIHDTFGFAFFTPPPVFFSVCARSAVETAAARLALRLGESPPMPRSMRSVSVSAAIFFERETPLLAVFRILSIDYRRVPLYIPTGVWCGEPRPAGSFMVAMQR